MESYNEGLKKLMGGMTGFGKVGLDFPLLGEELAKIHKATTLEEVKNPMTTVS